MITIDQIEDKIITEIEAALTGEGTVDTIVGDPVSYIVESNPSIFPAVFIQYVSNEPFNDIYPGVINFDVFFVHEKSVIKTNQRALYGFMEDAFSRLNGNTLDLNLNYPLTFVNQSNYGYTNDLIIYKQSYHIGAS